MACRILLCSVINFFIANAGAAGDPIDDARNMLFNRPHAAFLDNVTGRPNNNGMDAVLFYMTSI